MKNIRFSRRIMGLAILGLAGFLGLSLYYGLFSGRAPVFPKAELIIERHDGTQIPFAVEVATTPEQQAYGLMYRRSLPDNAGMVFVWETDRPIAMWMKNTYIPLDMLFVRHDGAIVKIAAHTQPLSLIPIFSGEIIRGVIELNAGAVKRYGINVGDKVMFSAFSGAS